MEEEEEVVSVEVCHECAARQRQIDALIKERARLQKQLSALSRKIPTRKASGDKFKGKKLHCPQCDAPVVERKGWRGIPFWGCSRYPKCKGSLQHDRSDKKRA